jgi:hypothetical protein
VACEPRRLWRRERRHLRGRSPAPHLRRHLARPGLELLGGMPQRPRLLGGERPDVPGAMQRR